MRRRFAAAVGVAALAVPFVHMTSASSAVFTVTTNADSGAGSLRAALDSAAGTNGADTINVNPGLGTIVLSSAIVYSGAGTNGVTTINGNGVVIDANGAVSGIIDDDGEGLVVNDFTIFGVGGQSDTDAAPIVTQGGAVTVSGCTIRDNAVDSSDGDVAGGVLSEGGSLTIDTCEITDNSADTDDGDAAGAALSEGGALTVLTSTISGNQASSPDGDVAGGVASEGGNITMRNPSIVNNVGEASGGGNDAAGGVLLEGGSATINGAEISCNEASTISGVAGGGAALLGEVTIGTTSFQANSASANDSTEVEDDLYTSDDTPTLTDVSFGDDASVCELAEPEPEPEPQPEPPAAQPAAETPRFTG
jgi:hypothetical protein